MDRRSPACPFQHRLDDGDDHCFCGVMAKHGYDIIGEDSDNFAMKLAEVNGIGLNDVVAGDVIFSSLPLYIPTIPRYSQLLFEEYTPDYVAVKLEDVVSAKELKVANNLLQRFGINAGTKVMLQSYGKDNLIENMWPRPRRYGVMSQLAELGFDMVTSINYSIWDEQTHGEGLINIKRGLITFSDYQKFEMPAVPHVYWRGVKDLEAWNEWLYKNPGVMVLAVNLQTLRNQDDWNTAMEQLKYFIEKIPRRIHFIVTGPSTIARLTQVLEIFPRLTITSALSSRSANCRLLLDKNLKRNYSPLDKSTIMRLNDETFEAVIKDIQNTISMR